MKYYKVHGYQEIWRENNISENSLKHLEMRIKEVKCRKDCYCSKCKSKIYKGEIALKTSQLVRYDIKRYTYCFECYGEIKFEIANDCIINEIFINTNTPEWHRKEYCNNNCNYKCLKGWNYKKIIKLV